MLQQPKIDVCPIQNRICQEPALGRIARTTIRDPSRQCASILYIGAQSLCFKMAFLNGKQASRPLMPARSVSPSHLNTFGGPNSRIPIERVRFIRRDKAQNRIGFALEIEVYFR
jgi:hypothetical protein